MSKKHNQIEDVTNEALMALFEGAHVGNMAVFFDPTMASQDAATLISQLGGNDSLPTIISRWSTEETVNVFGAATLPSLNPKGLTLGGAWTDRDLYEVGDTAFVFLALPTLADQTIDLEVEINGDTQRDVQVEVPHHGLCMVEFKDLQQGKYDISVSKHDHISISFMSAEYELAPFEASLFSHSYVPEENLLNVTLSIKAAGQILENAKVNCELHVGGYACASANVSTNQFGWVDMSFELPEDVDGDVVITVYNQADFSLTAQVALPGMNAQTRSPLVINSLHNPRIESSTAPLEDAQEVLGLYFRLGNTAANSPVSVEVRGNTAFITFHTDASVALIEHINPLTGEKVQFEWRDIANGDTHLVDLNTPWSIISIAAIFAHETPVFWEGGAIAVTDGDLPVYLETKDVVEPGTLTVLHITSPLNHTIPVAVVVVDTRQTTSQTGKSAGARTLQAAMKAAMEKVSIGTVEEILANMRPPARDQYLGGLESMVRGGGLRGGGAMRSTLMAESEPLVRSNFMPKGGAGLELMSYMPTTVDTQVDTWTAVRSDFARTVYADVVEVYGSKDILLQIPDGITTYKVHVFALDPITMHWMEVTSSIEATLPVYGIIHAPSYVASDVPTTFTVYVKSTTGYADVTVKHDGETLYSQSVETPATIELEAGVGTITVNAESEDGSDFQMHQINPIGHFTRTVRRTRILMPGEVATATDLNASNILILPGLAQELEGITLSLGSYAHQCCEQTAAIMLSGLIMALQGNGDGKDNFKKGLERERQMYHPGRGFSMYPDSGVGDGYYHRTAATRLRDMRQYVLLANDVDEDLRQMVEEAADMGDDACRAYGIVTAPEQITNAQEAWEAALIGRNDEALAFIDQHTVILPENLAKIDSSKGAVMDRTYSAYAAMIHTLMNDFGKALMYANWVISQMNEDGRLYSTIDSAAALLMIQALNEKGVGAGGAEVEIEVNEEVVTLLEAVQMEEIYKVFAMDTPVTILYYTQEVEDWSQFAMDFPVEVSLEAGFNLNVGQTTDLEVHLPDGYKDGHLVHVCLPPELVWLHGGGQVSLFSVDFEGEDTVRIPLTAIRPSHGQTEMAVLVANMFVEEEKANPGWINFTVR